MAIGWTEVALAAVVPAILVAAVPRRWLGWTMLAWLVSPIVGYVGVLAWETLTRPGISYPAGTAFYGFMLISPLLAPPWIALSLVGFGVGGGLRWVLRRKAPRAPAQALTLAIASAQSDLSPGAVHGADGAPALPPVTPVSAGWRPIHQGIENQPLRIGGRDIWASPWRPADGSPITLAHPIYPLRRLSYSLFTLADGGTWRFAACELDKGRWSFATRIEEPLEVLGTVTDTALQYGLRPRHTRKEADRADIAALLIDAASGRVMADCAAWASSSITPQSDGSLFLSVSEKGFEVLLRIDPARRAFRDIGEGGADQPLDELPRALDEAHRAIAQPPGRPAQRRFSPDGLIRVDMDPQEWSSSQWVLAPRIIDVGSKRMLLDLSNTDWDATVAFPAERTIRLDMRRFRGGTASVDIDLTQETYRITGCSGLEMLRPGGSLAALAAALGSAVTTPAPYRATLPASRWAAWRSALAILALTLCAIGAASYLSLRDGPQGRAVTAPLAKVPTPR